MKHNLSDLRAVIKDRRSIVPEVFKDRKVLPDMIKEMLNNAIWAPTHGLTQPWHFVVFQGDKKIELSEFLGGLYKKHTPDEDYLKGKHEKLMNRPIISSVVIGICMKRQESERIPEIEEVEAVACAVQNMHLTATAYGLGAFWSSPKVIYTPEMNEYLGLGIKDKCLGLFYVGYHNLPEWPKSHRQPLEYHVEWRGE